MKKILVTGVAGFIGHFVAERLLARGDSVVGVDNLNDYYDPSLKTDRLHRLHELEGADRFLFQKASIENRLEIGQLFKAHSFDGIIHLAAQAGVRYSLEDPHAYIDSNITGFLNILEGARSQFGASVASVTPPSGFHLVYASSSSVYGGNKILPFNEAQTVDRPISLYAATKKSNELMAHTYSHLFGIPMTGLRFFTVYGPWGRPDMAAFKFTRALLAGEPIDVYNFGNMRRDFTYIDDIVEGVIRVLDRPPSPCPTGGENFSFDQIAAHRVLNIGNSNPEPLMEFIQALEDSLKVKARINGMPMQPGDVQATFANTSALEELTGFAPKTPLRIGISKFVSWYKGYYKL